MFIAYTFDSASVRRGRPGAIVTHLVPPIRNRLMTLNLHMISRIFSLPLENDHDHFTSANVEEHITFIILSYES